MHSASTCEESKKKARRRRKALNEREKSSFKLWFFMLLQIVGKNPFNHFYAEAGNLVLQLSFEKTCQIVRQMFSKSNNESEENWWHQLFNQCLKVRNSHASFLPSLCRFFPERRVTGGKKLCFISLLVFCYKIARKSHKKSSFAKYETEQRREK